MYSWYGDDKYLVYENEVDLFLLFGNVGNVGIGVVSFSTKLEVSGMVTVVAFVGDGLGLINLFGVGL